MGSPKLSYWIFSSLATHGSCSDGCTHCGVSVTHRTAPPSAVQGWGGTGSCVRPHGACVPASAWEGLRDSTSAPVPFTALSSGQMCSRELLLAICSLATPGKQSWVSGTCAGWVLVPGLWSSPQARLGLSTCLKQRHYLVYSGCRMVAAQGDEHKPRLLPPSDAFRTSTCPNFAESSLGFSTPCPIFSFQFLFLALLLFPTLCPRSAVTRRRAVQPPKPHSSPPARQAPAAAAPLIDCGAE